MHRSEKCQKQTRLILFLGTPHLGSRVATMGQMAANIARLALQDANTGILKDLEIDNETLDKIHEQFVKIVLDRKIAIQSFQEGKGMTGVKGLSGKVGKFLYIPASAYYSGRRSLFIETRPRLPHRKCRIYRCRPPTDGSLQSTRR